MKFLGKYLKWRDERMSSTRQVKVGKCTIVIQNVPDEITEDQLKSFALMQLYQMNRDKAEKEMSSANIAS